MNFRTKKDRHIRFHHFCKLDIKKLQIEKAIKMYKLYDISLQCGQIHCSLCIIISHKTLIPKNTIYFWISGCVA